MNQAKVNKVMAGVGLAAFGGASILANVLSVSLPALEDMDPASIATWQAMAKKTDIDQWAYFWAVLFPLAALAGIEFVSRWTSLHNVLRYGVLGLASAVAVISSYLHIVHVLLWYGQGRFIAIIGPVAIDGLMILCTLQFLSAPPPVDVPVNAVPAVPLDMWPAPSMSPVPLGPAVPWTPTTPAVPSPRPVPQDKSTKDKPARSASWDRAEAARLIMSTDLDNHQIGDRVKTSYKTIQRLRREIKESEAMTQGRTQ